MTDAALIAAGYDLDAAWRGGRDQDGLSRYMGCSALMVARTMATEPGDYFSMRTLQIRAQRARRTITTKMTDSRGPRS